MALAGANGERAKDTCGAHGTTLETVRSRIRSIHDKPGVSRQAQAGKRIVKATGLVRGRNLKPTPALRAIHSLRSGQALSLQLQGEELPAM